MSNDQIPQESDNESVSGVTNLSFDDEGLQLIDHEANYSLFTVTSQNNDVQGDNHSELSYTSLDTVVEKYFIHDSSQSSLFRKQNKKVNNTKMEPEDADTFFIKFKKALLQWDDIFQGVDLLVTTIGEKKELMEDLKVMLNDLQDIQLFFELYKDDRYTDAMSIKLVNLRQKAKEMLIEIRSALNDDLLAAPTPQPQPTARQTPSTQPDSKQRIAAATATAAEPHITATANQLQKTLTDIRAMRCATLSEFKAKEAAFNATEKDINDTLLQLENLKREATTGDLESVATTAVDNATQLRAAKQLTMTILATARVDFGLLPGQQDSVKASVNITAPVFTGELLDTMDYFTFEDKLTEYFDVIGAYSDAIKLLKLKTECLKAPALTAAKDKLTFAAAMNELKRLYGQPRLLFSIKETEIRKLGKCPENYIEKRVWLIEMKDKLTGLLDLTRKMKIEHKLYSSNVIEVIELALREEDLEKLEEETYEFETENPSFDCDNKMQRAMYIKEYLELLIDKSTHKLNFKMSRGFKSAREVLMGAKKSS